MPTDRYFLSSGSLPLGCWLRQHEVADAWPGSEVSGGVLDRQAHGPTLRGSALTTSAVRILPRYEGGQAAFEGRSEPVSSDLDLTVV